MEHGAVPEQPPQAPQGLAVAGGHESPRRRREVGAGRRLILVSGSRLKFWSEPDAVKDHLWHTLDWLRPDALLNGGEPTGPDTWGWEWGVANIEARYNQVQRAEWTKYGRGAGKIRNGAMADRVVKAKAAGWAVEVHVWWDGRSTGSAHMRDVSARRGLMVVVHDMSRYRQ